MYENNNQNQEFQQQSYNYSTLPPQPPKKKRRVASTVAIILAVAVMGAGSGFGGAYLANSLNTVVSSQENEQTTPAEQAQPDATGEAAAETTAPYVKPETEVDDSLSTLNNIAQDSNGTLLTAEELYKKVNQSIVIVNNYQNVSSGTIGGDSNIQLYGTGSGIIFTTDGYILTNAHVVNGAAKVSVVVNDSYGEDQEIEATVVGSDSATDLAVLKVSRNEAFVAAVLGDSDSLAIGQEVCAIGNPAGLAKTITSGIISGLNRYSSSESGYELSSIQTDTAINPGNSGGALFDMYGNVVGVVNSKIVAQYTENLGFAITINEAKPVISDLINYGVVTGRPMLGVITTALNEYTAYLYGFSTTGLLVTEISENTYAQQSDLRVGDVVTAVNGTAVSAVADVQAIIKNMKPGDEVTLTVVRNESSGNNWGYSSGKAQTLDVTLRLSESGTY